EHLALEWSDVRWDLNRIRINSPKTGERWIPLFPELKTLLQEAWDAAPEGERYVISRYRTPDVNWRPQFLRILQQAGLKPWERLFQNLRSSRQTELVNEGHPIHAVCAWIGNSVKIAADHYLQVRDE